MTGSSYATPLPDSLRALPPAPPEWVQDGPHFVGAGAAKSGTTWWYELIGEHPEVRPNRALQKETNFFSYFGFERPSPSDTAAYRALFARPAGTVSGEWSPSYLLQPFALPFLLDACPQTRILVMLRDPVARVPSHISQMERVRVNVINVPEDKKPFFRMTSILPEALAASSYSRSLRLLAGRVPRERLLVMQYERCVRDPEAMLARTYRFLELDEGFRPARPLREVVNGSPTRAHPLSDDARIRLREFFADDVRAAAEVVEDFDPDLWPSAR